MTEMGRSDREDRRRWAQAHPGRAGLRAGGLNAALFAVVWPILVRTSITSGMVIGLVLGVIVGTAVTLGLKRGYLPMTMPSLDHAPTAIGNPDRPGSLTRFFARRLPPSTLLQLLRDHDGQIVELDCSFNARHRPVLGRLDASGLRGGTVSVAYPSERARVVPVADIRWVVTDGGRHGPF